MSANPAPFGARLAWTPGRRPERTGVRKRRRASFPAARFGRAVGVSLRREGAVAEPILVVSPLVRGGCGSSPTPTATSCGAGFAMANQIRNRLAEIGVTLEDRPGGTGRRVRYRTCRPTRRRWDRSELANISRRPLRRADHAGPPPAVAGSAGNGDEKRKACPRKVPRARPEAADLVGRAVRWQPRPASTGWRQGSSHGRRQGSSQGRWHGS